MKIKKITIQLTEGMDKVTVGITLPYPLSNQSVSFTFEAARDTGAKYVEEWLNFKPEVINKRPNQHAFRRYDTGIGYGGYQECTKCWQNTYSDDLTEVCPGKRA